MLTPEDLPILTAVGVVCVILTTVITIVTLMTDWRLRRKRLTRQLRRAASRGHTPVRNVDRFNTWQAALTWFYTYDRKTPVPSDQGCSAAFLNWLFAPIPENVK